MRRRGPGLIRTAGRTAVIAGTATAVSGRVANRQRNKAAAQQPTAPQQAPPPPAPAAGGDDVVEQLKELASLHTAGVLSDDEFEAAKAKLLS